MYDETKDVMFFTDIKALLLAFILLLLLSKFLSKLFKLSYFEYVLSLITSASLTLTFFTLFPVTTQRALTVFILRQMNQQSSYKFVKLDLANKI